MYAVGLLVGIVAVSAFEATRTGKACSPDDMSCDEEARPQKGTAMLQVQHRGMKALDVLHMTHPVDMLADDMAIDASTEPLLPELETTTGNCTCTSHCFSSMWDHHTCDYCKVKGTCGQWGMTGNWDYCAFPEAAAYEAQTHEAKQAELWQKLTASDALGKSAEPKGTLGSVGQMLTESMRTTFDSHRDVLPRGRTKVIHAQGAHCLFELEVSAGSAFTGALASGARTGLLRMGSASSLDHTYPQDVAMFPGLGIKFLRSGRPSANFVILRSAGPGGSYNFFDGSFSNHVAPPDALQALGKFQQASDCIAMVGLSDLCSFTQAGEAVPEPRFPFQLIFKPSGNVSFPNRKLTDAELLDQLSGIPVGSHLFSVYARAAPDSDEIPLGRLTTRTQCVRSLFGDAKLGFAHQRMEEDFALRPDWIPKVKSKGCAPTAAPPKKWQCPGVK